LAKKACHYIDGSWISGGTEELNSTSAASGSFLWDGFVADKDTVDKATQTAKQNLALWKKKTLDERMEYIHAIIKILTNEKKRLAEIISEEVGKPLWESKQEIDSMIAKGSISFEAYKERCPFKEDRLKKHNTCHKT